MDPKPTDAAQQTIYDNVEAISAIYEKAEHEMPAGQRGVERLVQVLGRPLFIGVYVALVGGWVVANMLMKREGLEPIDAPPFFWLQGFVTATSLLTTIVILIAQHRQSVLAERRAHLDLQVNILAEAKIAKVIALLEELRQDHPQLPQRVDAEAEQMKKPADPQLVIRALAEKIDPKTRGP